MCVFNVSPDGKIDRVPLHRLSLRVLGFLFTYEKVCVFNVPPDVQSQDSSTLHDGSGSESLSVRKDHTLANLRWNETARLPPMRIVADLEGVVFHHLHSPQ